MWTGEQVIEAFLTNAAVRAVEVLGAPIWIWLKSRKAKKDWPTPILIGFVIIVLASCIFLEEKITSWARTLTYGEEHIIRAWLDEQKLLNTYSSDKDGFTVNGSNRQIVFEIFKKKDSQGIVGFRTELALNPDVRSRIGKLSAQQRRQLWSELKLELSKHKIVLPPMSGDFKDLASILVERYFGFPPGTPKAVLYEQLSEFTMIKAVIDLVFETWDIQGKI